MKSFLLGLVLLAMAQVQAQPPSLAHSKGLNSVAVSRIDEMIQRNIDSQWIAGATAIILVDGEPVYYKAFGVSNLATKEKMRTDHIFRIASQTKAITSAGVMILLEEGKLMLDDPISKYIPAFSKTRVLDSFIAKDSSFTTKELKRKITIRHLLTHTSGIGYAQIGSESYTAVAAKMGVTGQVGTPMANLEDQVNKIAAIPLDHQPGEQFTYGLNIDVLGRLIEVVSGQSLAVFLKQKIFDPLGMKDTWFYLPKEKQNRLVALHTEDEKGQVATVKPGTEFLNAKLDMDYPNRQGILYSGGGGLASTIYDYSLFLQMILNKGTLNGKRILSPNSIDLMSSNQIGHVKTGYDSFGLGFGIVSAKDQLQYGVSEGSLEWGGIFSTNYWVDPKKKLVAQLFINQFPHSHDMIHKQFKVMVNSALDK